MVSRIGFGDVRVLGIRAVCTVVTPPLVTARSVAIWSRRLRSTVPDWPLRAFLGRAVSWRCTSLRGRRELHPRGLRRTSMKEASIASASRRELRRSRRWR